MSEQPKAAAEREAWTVLRLLQWTTDFFRKRGSQSPRLDAEVLLAHTLGCARIELYTAFGSEPSEAQREVFREMVRRRGEGTPVAYLVGYKEFYSLRLNVTPAVLIPRPETEHVVIEALDHAKRLSADAGQRPLRIADVGTGSGAIAIAVAKHVAAVHGGGAEITAIDISPEALALAASNADQLGVAEHINFVQGDLLAALPAEQTLDMVLSNPPYVSESEYAELDPAVRDHEPRGALVAGPQGTEIIGRLIEEAAARLVSGGQLVVELSPMIAQACAQSLAAQGTYGEPKLIKDLAGHRRVLSATRI
jgi:release factor glutamine methyltransferase